MPGGRSSLIEVGMLARTERLYTMQIGQYILSIEIILKKNTSYQTRKSLERAERQRIKYVFLAAQLVVI